MLKEQNIYRFPKLAAFFVGPASFFIGLVLLVWGCQSVAKPGKAITKFSLINPQGEVVGLLKIPFTRGWQVYPQGTEAGSPYEKQVFQLRTDMANHEKLLYFAATKNKNLFSYTQYTINNRSNINLESYLNFLKRTAYHNLEKGRAISELETEGGIKGLLREYSAQNRQYFELIYRIENFFLRSIIYIPLQPFQEQQKREGTEEEPLNKIRQQAMQILKGLYLEKPTD